MVDKLKSYTWILSLLWMGIIFFFSHQPGDESAELSGGITQFLLMVLEGVNIPLDQAALHGIIRTMAHFTIFFILGYLWYISLRFRDVSPGYSATIAFVLCVAYAFFDEAHQYFVPGRACELKDVMVDSIGAGCAILIGRLLSALRQKAFIKI
ncbi:MAG: VanZ family protein [Caldicoprobacterales bacterium]